MQTWPLLRNLPRTAAWATCATSASGKTIRGAWPPSSRLSRLTLVGRAADQLLAHAGRAGEADLADGRVVEEGVGELDGVADDEVGHACGEAGVGQAGEDADQGQRGLVGGPADHRAADGQGRGDLAGGQRGGEVPGGDGADHADGVLDGVVPLGMTLDGGMIRP